MKKLLLFIFLLAPLFAVAQTRIEVDPQTVVGDIKPMNAANNGPVKANMDSYTALQIPYARTHDAALTEVYVAKHCVDISAVFPDLRAHHQAL